MTLTVGRPRPGTPDPGPEKGARGFWPLRDLPVVGWLLLVAIVSFVHQWVPAPRWLMIHLLVLGAAGHSILVWSRYFADTLVRLPATPRREQSQRLVLFNLGVLVVAGGVMADLPVVVGVGATCIGVAVAWHVWSIFQGLRAGLGNRFAFTLRFYIAAGLLLLVGATLGVWLSTDPGEPVETRLRVAHASINLLGFIGLTVLGTIVTLGPTMLRTRIVDGSEKRTRTALWVLLGGIAVIVAASLSGVVQLVAAGLAVYAVGTGLVGWGVALAARAKPPVAFPTWSLAAGLVWMFGMLAWLASRSVLVGDWADLGKEFDNAVPYLVAGFVTQVLLGAISYLIPVVMGGGPSMVRAMNHDLDAGGALRVSLANAGLLVCILPVPSIIRVITSLLVLFALGSFVPVLLRAVRRRHANLAGEPTELGKPNVDTPVRPKGQNTGLAAVGLTLVMLAVAIGGSLDTTTLGGEARSAAEGVAATGQTVEVDVEAKDMRFTPASVEVNAGDRLVIHVKNTDPVEVHDMVLETGHDSGRLAPGEEATIDVGVVGRSLDGWCSVVGHRQMGMVFAVDVIGGEDVPAGADPGSTPPTDPAAAGGHEGHANPNDVGGHAHGSPSPDTVIPDPVLGPVPPGKLHKYTFEITEEKREIAPGVVQTRWMYNGSAPGPTLHGKVGDRFEITLVNHGTSGHSIDFHAGQRAPDKVMVTIPPGESLVYRFTATRSGIWMYHCSTMPMTAHIAAGLFGAVIIEPRDLPPVDKSFVLVQSENYYDAAGGPVDMTKLLAEKPDAVVFNGYHNAYQHEPLKVRAGERVRIWLLNAGPNRALSFHVVGGQFDRTYAEGAYLLGSARSPSRDGGSQALGLLPAQGGFVEMVLTEPGRYPLVNHIMVDAERGAYGIVEVTK